MLTSEQRKIRIAAMRQLMTGSSNNTIKSTMIATLLGVITELEDRQSIALTDGETMWLDNNCLLFLAVRLDSPEIFNTLYIAAGGIVLLQSNHLCQGILDLMLISNRFIINIDGVGFGPMGLLTPSSRSAGNCIWHTYIKRALEHNLINEFLSAYTNMHASGIHSEIDQDGFFQTPVVFYRDANNTLQCRPYDHPSLQDAPYTILYHSIQYGEYRRGRLIKVGTPPSLGLT